MCATFTPGSTCVALSGCVSLSPKFQSMCVSPAFVYVGHCCKGISVREKTLSYCICQREGNKSAYIGGNRALGGDLRLQEFSDLFALLLEFPQDWEPECGP